MEGVKGLRGTSWKVSQGPESSLSLTIFHGPELDAFTHMPTTVFCLLQAKTIKVSGSEEKPPFIPLTTSSVHSAPAPRS